VANCPAMLQRRRRSENWIRSPGTIPLAQGRRSRGGRKAQGTGRWRDSGHGSSDLLQTLLKHNLIDTLLAVPCGCRHRQALVRRRHNPRQLPACRHRTDRYRCCPACVRACRRPQVRRIRSRPGDRDLRFGYSTQVRQPRSSLRNTARLLGRPVWKVACKPMAYALAGIMGLHWLGSWA
jgi:hypothetical protein